MRGLLGIRQEHIGHFPGDQAWYTRMVLLVLVVAGMAVASMTTALLFTMGPDQTPRALAFGLLWGLAVLLIDLSILSPGERRAAWKTTLRILLALVLGVVISAPLLATLFRKDVDAAEEKRFSEVELVDYDDQRKAAEDEATTQADAAVTEAHDDWQKLNDEDLPRQETEEENALAACAAERYSGASSGVPGPGEITDRLCGQSAEEEKETIELRTRRDDAWAAYLTAQTTRDDAVDQAMAAWDRGRPQPTYDRDALGVWDRIERTHQVLGWPVWLVALALVLVDCLVVIFKVSRGETDYERHLQQVGTQTVAERNRAGEASSEVRVETHRAEADAHIAVGRERIGVRHLHDLQDTWDRAEHDGLRGPFVMDVLYGSSAGNQDRSWPDPRTNNGHRTPPRPPVADPSGNSGGATDGRVQIALSQTGFDGGDGGWVDDNGGARTDQWQRDLEASKTILIPGWHPQDVPVEPRGLIGRGGDAHVYLVRRGGKDYALKLPRPEARENIADEVRLYNNFRTHTRSQYFPSMIFPDASSAAEDCLVMEYYPRQSLDRFLHEGARAHGVAWIEPLRLFKWIQNIRQGLFMLWDFQVAHCDGKASNVLVTGNDRSQTFVDDRLLIADFSRATAVEYFQGPGPLQWTPVECLGSQPAPVSVARDVFSMLGGVPFYVVTGGLAPHGPGGKWLKQDRRHLTLEEAPLCPPALGALLDTWLDPRPEHRFVVPGTGEIPPSRSEVVANIDTLKARIHRQLDWLHSQLERDRAYRTPLFGTWNEQATSPFIPEMYEYDEERP